MPRSVTTFRLALAACLLLPLLAQAAGLGRLTVQSALGQPLRAEVAIVSLQPGESDQLTARIASPEAFRLAGIEFNSTLLNIRIAVERREGRPILRLTSSQPINEPFVELLLELQWATGRLVREYTFLLDPVEYKPPQPVAVVPPPAPAVAAKPVPAAPAVEARPLVSAPKEAGSYLVKRGDTLSKVARDNKIDGVSQNQMLVALYQANKSAFIRNNMYLMRSGQILKIPERVAATSISPAEATRVVRAQSVEFDEYRRSLGASVAAARAKPTAPAGRETPGRITPKPAEAAPKDTKDQIKLSKVDGGKPSAPTARAAAEDDRAAVSRALKESQSRVADLEKQVGDLKKLIEMKNQQLALLEQKAAGKPAAPAPTPVPQAPAPQKPAAEPAKAVEAPKPAAEAPKTVAPVAAPKPAAEPVKAKPAAPPPAPGLMEEFLGNPLALGGLAGVIALLVGYGAWAWRRKKTTQVREGGFGAIAAASAAAETAPTAAAAPGAAAAAAALAQVQAASAAAASDEVDPIAEADVYLAYGRDAQAETILKDSLAANPDRLVVHAKLLDIYAQRRDAAAFEKTALNVKRLSGSSGPEWEKAMSQGRSIDPDNGLYGTGAAAASEAAAPAAASPTVDFDLGGTAAPAAPAAVDFDIGATTGGGAGAPSFKPGDTVVLSAAEAQTASSRMDFDIGAATQEAAAPKPTPAAEVAPSSLDFNLDFDLGESKPAVPAAPPAPDVSSISLDLGTPGEAPASAGAASKWQEVATKLDLAKAYEEMGDKDGARELLDEVLKEGDAAQQEEATRMRAKLG